MPSELFPHLRGIPQQVPGAKQDTSNLAFLSSWLALDGYKLLARPSVVHFTHNNASPPGILVPFVKPPTIKNYRLVHSCGNTV